MSTFFLFAVSECKVKVDIAFLVDSSGSIRRSNWRKMKIFLQAVVDQFDVGEEWAHIALIPYSTNPKVVLRFNDLKGPALTAEAVKSKIAAMRQQYGLTFIDKALRRAQESVFLEYYGMRPKVSKVSFVLQA